MSTTESVMKKENGIGIDSHTDKRVEALDRDVRHLQTGLAHTETAVKNLEARFDGFDAKLNKIAEAVNTSKGSSDKVKIITVFGIITLFLTCLGLALGGMSWSQNKEREIFDNYVDHVEGKFVEDDITERDDRRIMMEHGENITRLQGVVKENEHELDIIWEQRHDLLVWQGGIEAKVDEVIYQNRDANGGHADILSRVSIIEGQLKDLTELSKKTIVK